MDFFGVRSWVAARMRRAAARLQCFGGGGERRATVEERENQYESIFAGGGWAGVVTGNGGSNLDTVEELRREVEQRGRRISYLERMLRVKGDELARVTWARDAAKEVLQNREEKMIAMRREMENIREELRQVREREMLLEGELAAVEGEREAAISMLEEEERRIGGEGQFPFQLGPVMEEEEEETEEEGRYENVEFGGGGDEDNGDETGGYLSCCEE
jgi:chromosome segregation ATPase